MRTGDLCPVCRKRPKRSGQGYCRFCASEKERVYSQRRREKLRLELLGLRAELAELKKLLVSLQEPREV